jgi:hypothetical protein
MKRRQVSSRRTWGFSGGPFRGWLAEGAPPDYRLSASPESRPPTARG